jgi:ATP-dependent exoDNAse (exonuclease V) beta subunit
MLWEEVVIAGLHERLVAAPLKRRRDGSDVPTPYDYLSRLERRRNAHEAARVLYVGATRTVRRLHLCAVVERDAKGEPSPAPGSFLGLLWPVVGAEFLAAADADGDSAASGSGEFVSSLQRAVRPVVTTVAPFDAAAAADTAEETDGSGDTLAADLGTLVHAYLEMAARDGVDAWPAERLDGLRAAMSIWLGQRGHGDGVAALGADRAVVMLRTAFASQDGRWLLARHEAAGAELALASAQADGVALHVVDRTFVDQGVRWIIDYKTAEAGDDPAVHAERYRLQLERYASLFEAETLPIRMGIYYVRSGRLVELACRPPRPMSA